jgi:hypothetical protein
MIQYSLLGPSAASTDLNTTFRGLAPSPSSGRTDLTHHMGQTSGGLNQFCPRMGKEPVPENVVFKSADAADGPRRLYWAIPHVQTYSGDHLPHRSKTGTMVWDLNFSQWYLKSQVFWDVMPCHLMTSSHHIRQDSTPTVTMFPLNQVS